MVSSMLRPFYPLSLFPFDRKLSGFQSSDEAMKNHAPAGNLNSGFQTAVWLTCPGSRQPKMFEVKENERS
jgi:hypothetical protein